MARFGESILYRFKPSFARKVLFHVLGQDFIGAAIRVAHFSKAMKKIEMRVKKGRFLDAGCGTGDFSFYIAEKFRDSKIDAVDVVEKTIKDNEKIKKRLGIQNIRFHMKDLLSLGYKDKYDFVFMIGTMIYFNHEQNMKILKNICRAIKEKGYFYIDVPQSNFYAVNIIPIKHYKKEDEQLAKENKGVLYGIEDLKKILESLGMQVIDIHYSFGYFGKLAWEIDSFIKEKRFYRTKLLLLPILKLLSWVDAQIKNKKGSCISALCQKI